MTPENFVYWLQGYLELTNDAVFSPEQVQIIKDHLKLVFQKETPTYTYPKFGEKSKEQLICKFYDHPVSC